MLGVGSLRSGVEIRHWSPSTVPAAHYKPSSMSIIEVFLDIAAILLPITYVQLCNGTEAMYHLSFEFHYHV